MVRLCAIYSMVFALISPGNSLAQPKKEAELVGQMSYAIGKANGLVYPAIGFAEYCSTNSSLSRVFAGFKDTLLNSVAPMIGALNGSYFELLTKRYGKEVAQKQEALLKTEIEKVKSEMNARALTIKNQEEANGVCERVLQQIKERLYDLSEIVTLYFSNLERLDPDYYQLSKKLFNSIIEANRKALEKANSI